MGHPVNRGLARSGQKKPEFKRAEKIKTLTLEFFWLNGPTLRAAAHLTALLMRHSDFPLAYSDFLMGHSDFLMESPT